MTKTNVTPEKMDVIINIQIMKQSIDRRNGFNIYDSVKDSPLLAKYTIDDLRNLQEVTIKEYNNSFN